ncbi:MAG: transporter substrate-binding domain-containing protein [Acidobacteria bacterium]|nr:transporter substrate-binding domain-containing protein [Acidobacteriota bacterium]
MFKSKLRRVGLSITVVGLAGLGMAPLASASSAGSVNNPGQANKISNSYVAMAQEDVALHKMLPPSILKKGFILVGAQMMNAPDDFFSGTANTPVGFEVNLAHAIGRELGVGIKYLQLPVWSSIVPAVQDGRVDMSMTAMNDLVAREKLINFVDYLVDGIGILVKGGNPQKITGPSSLCGKNVTDSAGTTQELYLQSLNATGGPCASNPIHEVIASSTAQELANLASGRADAVLNDNITDAYDTQTMHGAVASVNYPPIHSGPYGIGVGKSDVKLLRAVDGALKNLMKGGSHSIYKEILTAWNVAPVSIPAPLINGCVKPIYQKFC